MMGFDRGGRRTSGLVLGSKTEITKIEYLLRV